MEALTPDPAERFASKIEQLRPAPGAGPLALLVWEFLACLLRLFLSIAERRSQQQACRDDAAVEPGCASTPGGFAASAGGHRPGAAGGPNAGARAAVSAAVVAACGTPVLDDATPDDGIDDDCIDHERGVRATCAL